MNNEQLVDDYLAIVYKVSELFPFFKVVSRAELLSALENDEEGELRNILIAEIDRRTAIYIYNLTNENTRGG